MKPRMLSVVLIIVASAITSLSMSVQYLWFLAPIGLGTFFYTLLFKTETKGISILNGFIFGMATGGAGVWWFWHALPVGWIAPTSTITQFGAVFITWILVTIALAIPTAIFSYGIWKLKKNNFIGLFLIFGWTLQEFGREISFAILTIAPESVLEPHFSSANIGYTLANNNHLLQLAEGGGVYNLSIVVALIATTLAFSAHVSTQKKSKVLLFILFIIISVPFFLNGSEETNHNTMNVTLLTTDIPRSSGIDTSIIYRRELEKIAARETYPDMIVLPEGSGLTKISDGHDRKEILQGLFGEQDVMIISSDYVDENNKTYSRLTYDTTASGTIETYDKIFLMPQGEYTPRIISLIFPILRNNYVERYIKSLYLQNGSELKSVEYNGAKIGALLCSESLSPRLYRKLATEQGVNILVNLSRTSWFHNSIMLHNKTIEIGKVHAVQNRAYYLQATNGSPSFAINSNGKLIGETEWGKTETIDIEVHYGF